MKLLSPTYLIALAFLQVSVAYLISMKATAESYGITLNYFPLLLWVIAFIFVTFGAHIAALLFRHRGGMMQANVEFLLAINKVDSSRLGLLYFVAFCGVLVTSFTIAAYAGGLPILSIISGSQEISALNEAQADALPGLYGIHAMMTALMEYCLGLLILKSLLLNNKAGVRIFLGSIVVVLATIIEGKRQGLAIFICFLGVIIFAAAKLQRGNFSRQYKRALRLFVGLALLSFMAVAYVTFVRLDAAGYGEEAIQEPLRYASMPLINLESLSSVAGWWGLELNLFKPLDFLLPAKLGFERGVATIPVPEPTSPSGFFSMAYLYWGGVLGLSVYALAVGLFSGYVFFKAAASPLFLLFYGFIVWSLLMSHIYNHFLTITFIPLQFIVLLIVKYVVFKAPIRRTKTSSLLA